jgi:hypothetical protein
MAPWATAKRSIPRPSPDSAGPTGRVKFGTESNGGFKNSNAVFDYCRGLALETVDGVLLEDVAISNATMRDIANSPIFLRLGSRMRAPEGTSVGALRRINISNFVAYNADPRYGSIISGIPGHDIGVIPAYGFFIRHLKGIEMNDLQVSCMKEDLRPAILVESVQGIEFSNLNAQHAAGVPALVLNHVEDFTIRQSPSVADANLKAVKHQEY